MYNDYYVYLHRRKDNNEVFYVGKGKGKRGWSIRGRNHLWQDVVALSGFVVEIVESNLSNDDAIDLEKETIKFYRENRHYLCNMTLGGEGCSFVCDETRKKLALARLGHRTTKETRDKISRLHKGVRKSEESNRIGRLGRHDPSIGKVKTYPIDTRRPVLCSNGEVFASVAEATTWCRTMGRSKAASTSIVACCRGRSKSAYGFSWEYVEKSNLQLFETEYTSNTYCIRWRNVDKTDNFCTEWLSVKDVWEVMRWRTGQRNCIWATILHRVEGSLIEWTRF